MERSNTKQNPTCEEKRNSAIESLRIVAMLAIVLSHACVHSGFEFSPLTISLNHFFVQWGVFGNLGVDIFILISGYFLSTRELSTKSLSKLWAQVWFYSIFLFCVCKFAFGVTYSLKEYLQVFFPVIFAEYWFFTAYVVLLMISPCLNILIREATQNQLRNSLLCMICMWVIIPTFTTKNLYGSEIPQFAMLYMVGAYFKKYPCNILQKKEFRISLTFVSLGLMFLSTVVLDLLGTKFSIFQNMGILFYYRHSLLTVGAAIGMFAIAVYSKPFYNKFINAVSGCTFGVYLIHENPAIRTLLWKQFLVLPDYSSFPFLIIMIVMAVIIVFSVSVCIEFFRQKTVAKPMTIVIDNGIRKVMQVIRSIYIHKN